MIISPIKISPLANRNISGFAPSNTTAPVVSGIVEVGQTLTSTTGTWTGTPPIVYSYQWKRGAINIGTNSSTYVAVTADLEQNITCTVTATNSFGNASQISNIVVIVFNRLSHNLKWAVDTNNMSVIGTTTTLIDYFGNNSLANTVSTAQPTLVTSVLNGKSILRFATDDLLIKSVSNWFASDTSGQITLVVKSNSDIVNALWGSSDEASTRIFDVRKQAVTGTLSHLHNVGNTHSGTIIGTADLGETNYKIITVLSTGTAHKLFISSGQDTISSNTLTGGIWLADFPTQRDNITLGGIKFSSFGYADVDVYGAYYGNYSNDTAIIQLHNELKQILGL